MFDLLRVRRTQGLRTTPFLKEQPRLPERFRGLLKIDASKCDGCAACIEVCPTQAIAMQDGRATIDLGRCVFCAECVEACPAGAIEQTTAFAMATRTREALVIDGEGVRLAEAIDRKSRALFGRSLALRQVSAGGCNGCEAEVNALSNVVFDISRFGISIVASPRHADGLLITGPVTKNMRLALEKTYAAVPAPKMVIAVGGCAISGGPFRGHDAVEDGVEGLLPIDLYVPGCPPHPLTVLDGLLRLLGRIEAS